MSGRSSRASSSSSDSSEWWSTKSSIPSRSSRALYDIDEGVDCFDTSRPVTPTPSNVGCVASAPWPSSTRSRLESCCKWSSDEEDEKDSHEGLFETPRVEAKLMTERIKGYLGKRLAPPERRVIADHWSYPKGRKMRAQVLQMTAYVDDRMDVFIPGEIAMVTFSVYRGLKAEKFCTLVDPAEKIPLGHRIASLEAAEAYGLPFPGYSKTCQEYEKIVDDMEAYITGYGKPVGSKEKSHRVIFCLQEHLGGYKRGLTWLYGLAGKEFTHQLCPLEGLVVTLSLCGLERMWIHRGMDPERESFFDFLHTTESAIASVGSCVTAGTAPSKEDKAKADRILSKYIFDNSVAHSAEYLSRRVSLRRTEHPGAYLGAFIFDDHATHYLDHSDYLYLSQLACDYHQWGRCNVPLEWRDSLKRPPNECTQRCALLSLIAKVYLILDALLVNFGIESQPGTHGPP